MDDPKRERPWLGLNVSALGWREQTGISNYVRQLVRAFLSSPERSGAISYFLSGRWKSARGEVEALVGRSVRSSRLPEKALFRLHHLPFLARRGMAGLRVYHETSMYPRAAPSSCRRIYTLYDVLPLIRPDWYSPSAVRGYVAAFGRAARSADRIIVQSLAARADVLQAAPGLEKKLALIPNGVDREVFRADIPSADVDRVLADLGLKQPYILFAGAIQPRKNVDHLVQAFFQLAGDVPHSLVLAGPVGWQGREILARIEASVLRARVRHVGFVPAAHLPALYRGADLYAFPSRGEGFGLTLLEAMASGVPVLTSSVSALPEVAGEAALLVHPEDIDGLAGAMRRGLEDPELRRTLIERGLAQAARYAWSRTADLTWDLYRHEAGESGD
jgi:glycosyltransferase involved in cell wall biosynthesis